jgi:hypothetical protein
MRSATVARAYRSLNGVARRARTRKLRCVKLDAIKASLDDATAALAEITAADDPLEAAYAREDALRRLVYFSREGFFPPSLEAVASGMADLIERTAPGRLACISCGARESTTAGWRGLLVEDEDGNHEAVVVCAPCGERERLSREN